ncbi:PQQ-binding-like beta-propeller repeat protein [Schlesneria sp. T3-172]|uniref:outer membrane protein assembly factor BamB family protein n=1 Tax=Schlesneria sphaerica TaxID=3373610 RepID=UPI0037C50B40
MLNRFFQVVCLCGLILSGTSLAHAGDWPQILGPHRNGIADAEQIADEWQGGKPPQLWEARIGAGFAGVSVRGETVVLFHREKGNDKLTAFDAAEGTPRWTTSFPSTFRPQIVEDNGPRAMPTIDQDAVLAYSPQGGLYCVDLKTGEKRWERQTHEDFGANGGYFGAGSSPLVVGKRVFAIVGGDKKRAGVVAFDLESGATLWTAINDQASYSAPVLAVVDGTSHLLCITRLNLVSLDPETGEERFRTPFGQRGPTVNGALPVISGKHALLTASYGIGAQFLELKSKGVEVVWSDELLSSQYTTPIHIDGAIYGIDGRQDGGEITLKCFDPVTRKEHWSKSGFGYATLIAADGKLLVMQTDGVLKLVRLSKTGYEELASAELLSGTTRALPALANGRFYIRNERTLSCFDVAKR